MTQHILGIDIAKLKFDVALLLDDQTFSGQFVNSPAGFKALRSWLKQKCAGSVHACLEATGNYGEALAKDLHAHGHLVSVVNPASVKAYSQARLRRTKTDASDACLIADFCRTQKPPQWFPPSAEVEELQALTRRIEVLEEMRQMERNRFSTAPEKTRPSIERVIDTLQREIEALQSEIDDHINRHPQLKQRLELLGSIPGIGEKTAQMLLSEIRFERYDSARQVAAYAGVTPRTMESGTSLKRSIVSKLGSRRLRRKLYFPAIVARHHNTTIRAFAARLEERGKTPKQIICAAMRKLLHIAFGVLKSNRPFDPGLAFAS